MKRDNVTVQAERSLREFFSSAKGIRISTTFRSIRIEDVVTLVEHMQNSQSGVSIDELSIYVKRAGAEGIEYSDSVKEFLASSKDPQRVLYKSEYGADPTLCRFVSEDGSISGNIEYFAERSAFTRELRFSLRCYLGIIGPVLPFLVIGSHYGFPQGVISGAAGFLATLPLVTYEANSLIDGLTVNSEYHGNTPEQRDSYNRFVSGLRHLDISRSPSQMQSYSAPQVVPQGNLEGLVAQPI